MTTEGLALRPFYFMVVFWGAAYREYFTDLLLASLLAPNNVPALKPARRSRFLIVTTRDDWIALQGHENFRLLQAYLETDWIEMTPPHPDEPKMLVMSRAHRQMAERAFDHGAYGVFLTPDLVLSDGSVAAMERLAEEGRKVVLAVAIRFAHETMLADMEQERYLKAGQPLVITSRELMRIALRHLHSETRRYEFDAPWFAESPISLYWWVPSGDGMIIHSFSWAPLVVDYAALKQHDTETFKKWTLDGDYIYRNFPDPADVYVVTDSDEIALVSFTKESDLHFELDPYLRRVPGPVATRYKTLRLRLLHHSHVMDPLKRTIFPRAVYLHAGDISPAWTDMRRTVERLVRLGSQPIRRRDEMMTLVLAFAFPVLWPRLLDGLGVHGRRVLWRLKYRRFLWQRLKEKSGLITGRSRSDDGRDWLSPAMGLMNPVHSVWVITRSNWARWRYRRLFWQRIKERIAVGYPASRWDDGTDWVTPTLGLMNPLYSLRTWLTSRRRAGALDSSGRPH